MCRFALYLGTPILIDALVTRPTHSIIHQSYASQERPEPTNGDGFGIAWYAPGFAEPGLFRQITPAWSSQNLQSIGRVTRTHCLLAHVRAATRGLAVHELNCHPFTWGPFAFMHNGFVGEFSRIRRRLQRLLSDAAYDRVAGSTDSEHLFALFTQHLERLQGDRKPLQAIAAALRAVVADVEEISGILGVQTASRLNMAVSDGRRAAVTRYGSDGQTAPSLHVTHGRCYCCREGQCSMEESHGDESAVIVASEPLSQDGHWDDVAVNHIVLVDEDLSVHVEPL